MPLFDAENMATSSYCMALSSLRYQHETAVRTMIICFPLETDLIGRFHCASPGEEHQAMKLRVFVGIGFRLTRILETVLRLHASWYTSSFFYAWEQFDEGRLNGRPHRRKSQVTCCVSGVSCLSGEEADRTSYITIAGKCRRLTSNLAFSSGCMTTVRFVLSHL